MRQQKSGRIVLIGSLAGMVGVSGMGYTSAVKHALEGYAEALRLELEPAGIYVSVVQPSFFKTSIYERRIASEGKIVIPDYDVLRATLEKSMAEDSAKGDDPAKVADKVMDVLRARVPKLRYPVGKNAGLLIRLKRYMPEALFLNAMRGRLKG
jgi:short-subunit dehydrogenase